MKLSWIAPALAAGVLFAQPPGPPRMHGMAAKTDAVQSYLNLTDAQVASLKQLRQSEAAALKPLFDEMRPLRANLRRQSQSSNADATAVGQSVLSLQKLEQQAAPIRASFEQQAVAVLTADQKAKLTALQNAAALMPAIHQAMELHLLTPPAGEGPGGFGPMMMHPRGPGAPE